jgi:hypothetical protein
MLARGPPSSFTTDRAAGGEPCVEPMIPLHSHHVSLVQWTNPSLPVTRDLGLRPLGGLMSNRYSPVSVVSLQYYCMLAFVIIVKLIHFVFLE